MGTYPAYFRTQYRHLPLRRGRELSGAVFDLDVFIPELGIFEPRPWHKELPMKPKVWDALSSWGTDFAFDLANLK